MENKAGEEGDADCPKEFSGGVEQSGIGHQGFFRVGQVDLQIAQHVANGECEKNGAGDGDNVFFANRGLVKRQRLPELRVGCGSGGHRVCNASELVQKMEFVRPLCGCGAVSIVVKNLPIGRRMSAVRRKSFSFAQEQTAGEEFWKTCSVDGFGGGLNIVGRTVVSDGGSCLVVDAIGGAPVGVAGLTNASGIDEVLRFAVDLERVAGFEFRDLRNGTESAAEESEATLTVCVAEEVEWTAEELFHAASVAFLDEVEVFVDGAAVHEPEAGVFDGSTRHFAQIGPVGLGEDFGSPV